MSNFSNPRVARPVHRQFIQSLEDRRLMSLTGGFDFAPAVIQTGVVAEAPISHGFDQAPPAMGNGGFAGFDQPSPGPAMFQAPTQSAPESPAADTSAVAVTATTTDAAKVAVTSSTTLSALYSTLGNSTVAQIDAASAKSLSSNLDESPEVGTHGSVIAATAASAQPASAGGSPVVETTTVSRTLTVPFETSDAALARALSVIAPPVALATPVAATTEHDAVAPSWMSLRKLEDELIAVREVTNQVVTEIGRDSAIALSHLASLMESYPVSAIAGNAFSAWKSVAITGAIIAGAAYAQSKTSSEKQKPAIVFSSRLIDIIPT